MFNTFLLKFYIYKSQTLHVIYLKFEQHFSHIGVGNIRNLQSVAISLGTNYMLIEYCSDCGIIKWEGRNEKCTVKIK